MKAAALPFLNVFLPTEFVQSLYLVTVVLTMQSLFFLTMQCMMIHVPMPVMKGASVEILVMFMVMRSLVALICLAVAKVCATTLLLQAMFRVELPIVVLTRFIPTLTCVARRSSTTWHSSMVQRPWRVTSSHGPWSRSRIAPIRWPNSTCNSMPPRM